MITLRSMIQLAPREGGIEDASSCRGCHVQISSTISPLSHLQEGNCEDERLEYVFTLEIHFTCHDPMSSHGLELGTSRRRPLKMRPS